MLSKNILWKNAPKSSKDVFIYDFCDRCLGIVPDNWLNFFISFYLTEMLNPEVSSQPFYFPGNMFKNTPHPHALLYGSCKPLRFLGQESR